MMAAFLDEFQCWVKPEFRKKSQSGPLHGDLILLDVVLLLTRQTEMCEVTQPSGQFQVT